MYTSKETNFLPIWAYTEQVKRTATTKATLQNFISLDFDSTSFANQRKILTKYVVDLICAIYSYVFADVVHINSESQKTFSAQKLVCAKNYFGVIILFSSFQLLIIKHQHHSKIINVLAFFFICVHFCFNYQHNSHNSLVILLFVNVVWRPSDSCNTNLFMKGNLQEMKTIQGCPNKSIFIKERI